MQDGEPMDGEYQGGYFDAGDHLKFQLPGAWSIARLAWLTWQFKDGLEKTYFDVRNSCQCCCSHFKLHCLLRIFIEACIFVLHLLMNVCDAGSDQLCLGT